MSKRESTECRAFRKCFTDLADGITDPGWLATRLYSKELIGRDLHKQAVHQERVKTELLLSAVEDQIVVSPTIKFREFLDVLQNEPSLQRLATLLEDTHHELASIRPSMSTPPSPLPSLVDVTSSLPLPSAKRPRTENVLQSYHRLEHTIHFQQNHQTLAGYPQARFMQCTTPCCHLFAFDTYASYLKSVYTRETKLPIYEKWPQVKSKKYINLALIEREDITKPEADQFMRATIHGNIDDIKKSKRAMNIGQIAQLPDGSQPKCILVEGAPGVGKSTFAWKLCRKWGKGKLLWQYQLVVLLRLRDKSVRAAKNIFDLFRYHDHQIQQAAVEKIQTTAGKGVLLLFDGYDELPEELRTENSIFIDIITGRELPEATVLITSRPWASEFLHIECKSRISQHIEILGFTKANIQFYLESTIADDPSLLAGLKKYISCYPHIGSLMYIPLYSAFVVEIYRNNRNKALVPKTTTELYFSLIRDLLRYKWKMRSFSDLPQHVYQQLCELGRIAYKGIMNKQQVIFSDLSEDFETLGLMQCVPEMYAGEDAMVSYSFLHLTVQEYLAAFHLSRQPVEEQIELYKQYCSGEDKRTNNHLQMVLCFLSGIKKFSEYPCEVMNALCVKKHNDDFDIESFCNCNIDLSDDKPVHKVTFDILHWLFEAQDNDVIAKVLGSSNIQPCWQSIVTPSDCFVLGYCVSHSNYAWKIDLERCGIGDDEVEMLVQGTLEEEINCTGGISEINLEGGDITAEAVKHLVSIPKQLINKLKILSLCDESASHKIGPGGAVPAIASLTTTKSFEKLQLDGIRIGMEDCQALRELLSSSTSLKELNISWNDLPPEAIELIISGLHHNTTLQKLDMGCSYFSHQNAISLASALQKNHTLVDLNLGQCDIDSDGACPIMSALCMNKKLRALSLHNNSIGVEGAAALVELLRTNHTLVNLDLWQCDIDSDVACQLASVVLCTNDTLQKLNLDNNPIGVKGATAFAEMLRTNCTIVSLWLSDCDITSDVACQLASALCANDTLQDLSLRDNPIGFKGAAAFSDMLKINHTLVSLDLGGCNIDSNAACQLANSLCTNNTLRQLWLNWNPIGDKGAAAVADMLLKNKSLKFLNLGFGVSIGEEGIQKLIDSMTHNKTVTRLLLPRPSRSLPVVDSRVEF